MELLYKLEEWWDSAIECGLQKVWFRHLAFWVLLLTTVLTVDITGWDGLVPLEFVLFLGGIAESIALWWKYGVHQSPIFWNPDDTEEEPNLPRSYMACVVLGAIAIGILLAYAGRIAWKLDNCGTQFVVQNPWLLVFLITAPILAIGSTALHIWIAKIQQEQWIAYRQRMRREANL